MNKCANCGKEKSKRLYCDDACRAKLRRRVSHRIRPLVASGSVEGAEDAIDGQS